MRVKKGGKKKKEHADVDASLYFFLSSLKSFIFYVCIYFLPTVSALNHAHMVVLVTSRPPRIAVVVPRFRFRKLKASSGSPSRIT